MDDRLMPKSASNGYPPVTPASPCIEEDIVEEEISEDTEAPLVYKISDRPPVHLILFFAFQVSDVQLTVLPAKSDSGVMFCLQSYLDLSYHESIDHLCMRIRLIHKCSIEVKCTL